MQWLRDDWEKTAGPVTAVRLLRKYPRLLLSLLARLAVAYGVAGSVAAVLHKGWLLSQYAPIPAILVGTQIGGRLYQLKRREQAAAPSQEPTELP